MKIVYCTMTAVCAFAAGYINGEHVGVKKVRTLHAHENVSAFIRGETHWVSEADLEIVNPELREAAQNR